METITSKELRIERIINAPRELVFEVFTKANHLQHWWGPVGFRIEVLSSVIKPGGFFHYCMAGENDLKMCGRFSIQEISAPERFVFINSFADEAGNIIRPPFEENWPWEILNSFYFYDENGKTRIVLRAEAYNASEEECEIFNRNFSSMNEGYGGTFDKLDEYLKTVAHD
jgi:uncharacterized protein YndB with AHSA1/START domain